MTDASSESEGLDIPSPDGDVNTIHTTYKVGQDNVERRSARSSSTFTTRSS